MIADNEKQSCKYCKRPYAYDGKSTTCQCGCTPLSLFHYHWIMEKLEKIETLVKEQYR